MAKRPRAQERQRPKATGVRASRPASSSAPKIAWRFSTLDTDFPQPGGWGAVAGKDMQAIAGNLAALDGQTRVELQSRTAISSGKFTLYADAASFTRAARRRLEQRECDDRTQVARIRLGSKKRLYAVEAPDGVFELLWWDPAHRVYPTEPHNT